MTTKPNPQAIEIFTPDELLENAEGHYSANERNSTRAAVLEAMAALETYVHKRVFSALEVKIDQNLIKWIEDKTKTDFDSRVTNLASVALGCSINRNGQLWDELRKARTIRNRVVHQGAKVAIDEARFVIDTVYKWIEFLGSSVEVQVALLRLKRFFNNHPYLSIKNEQEAKDILKNYFRKTKFADINQESEISNLPGRPDVLLKIGSHSVIVESKLSGDTPISSFVSDVTDQLSRMMEMLNADTGAAILFYRGRFDPAYENILVLRDGKIFILVIPAN